MDKTRIKKIKPPLYKRLLNLFGLLIVILSFIFIIRALMKLDLSMIVKVMNFYWIPWTVLFVLIYGICYVLYSIAWKYIVEFFSKKKLDTRLIINIYMRSNAAKYIPGNIFHFAGRHMLVRREGISDKALLLSNMTEIMLLVLYSGMIVIAGFASGVIRIPESILKVMNFNSIIIAGSAVLLIVVSVLIFMKIKNKEFRILDIFRGFDITTFLKTSITYILIFMVLGLILYLVAVVLLSNNNDIFKMLYVICSFALAWVLGYIVPGAPGGLGIRETVIIIMLSAVYDHNTSVMSSIILRFVTITGDVLSFVFGNFLVRNDLKKSGKRSKK